MDLEPLETAEGGEFSGCRQISVFLENRLGQLLRLTRLFDGADVVIAAISVEGSVDCAIVRLLVNDPDTAHEMLNSAGFAIAESEVLVVELPPGRRGIMAVAAALISAEVNINYVYPLFATEGVPARMAIQVDNLPNAGAVLNARRVKLVAQHEL
jgi:hypothetical protein